MRWTLAWKTLALKRHAQVFEVQIRANYLKRRVEELDAENDRLRAALEKAKAASAATDTALFGTNPRQEG